MSLGAWLREAAEEKLESARARRFASTDELREFFARRDEQESAPEPDWDEHIGVMERSRTAGSKPT
jgi:hypothetical protein